MKLIDDWFGRPTAARLLADATRWLQARGMTSVFTEEVLMQLHLQRPDGGRLQVHLGGLWPHWRQAGRRQRALLLEQFLADALATEDALPTHYASASPRLRPVLRSTHCVAAAQQSVAAMHPGTSFELPHQAWAGDLVVALVLDQAHSMAWVDRAMLARWGVDWQQALDDALDNLRRLSASPRWQELVPGVWRGHWADGYDSARALLPEVIHRGPARRPLVMLPFREALLLTSAEHAPGIEAMCAWALGQLDGPLRWLSPQLLRLDERRWTPHAPHDRAAALQAMLLMRSRLDAYARQQQALQEQAPEGPHAASFRVTQAPDGALVSYALWIEAEGGDVLLPEADRVLLAWQVEGRLRELLLPWPLLMAQLGDLLETTGHQPPRYRTRRFPDPARLAALWAADGPAAAGEETAGAEKATGAAADRAATLRLDGSAG